MYIILFNSYKKTKNFLNDYYYYAQFTRAMY